MDLILPVVFVFAPHKSAASSAVLHSLARVCCREISAHTGAPAMADSVGRKLGLGWADNRVGVWVVGCKFGCSKERAVRMLASGSNSSLGRQAYRLKTGERQANLHTLSTRSIENRESRGKELRVKLKQIKLLQFARSLPVAKSTETTQMTFHLDRQCNFLLLTLGKPSCFVTCLCDSDLI